MKLYKIISCLLMCMLLLAACGGGDDSGSSSGGSGSTGGSDGPTTYPQTYSQSVTVSAKGGEQIVTLVDLSTAISSVGNTPDWLVISPQFYTSGAPTLKLEAQENTETSERNAVVSVLASSGDKVSLTVVQEAGEDHTGIDNIHNEQTDQPAYAPRQ